MISFATALGLLAALQQEVATPVEAVAIRQTSFRPIQFVPAGWKLLDKTDGDLNGDGRLDAALIIQRNDPSGVISNSDGLGFDTYDTNPRVLLVTIQDDLGQYQLVGRDDDIIPDHDRPTIDDPYELMRIDGGKLHLHIRFFANAGSWSMFANIFHFRWSGNAMQLIGFDKNYVHRGSGEMSQASVNYLSCKRKDSAGSIEDDKLDWKWRKLPKCKPPKMGEIGNGFDFEG